MRTLHPKEKVTGDHLPDSSPLIGAAASGKLRLVRLLVDGGAQVNRRNPRGETPLLAACKALRGEPAGPDAVKLLTYLLQNKADPNAQDRAGRTALMYACMERAGVPVASALLAAGADPCMEDCSGASALVYAINTQHQPTVKVLMDACRARGRDIIVIATDAGVNGGPVTRRYLNVPPSPDTSPVSCMSPSDIVLKTGSPGSSEGGNVFSFRGTSKRGSGSGGGGDDNSRRPSRELSPASRRNSPAPRQRVLSEPCLAIHNLARLNRAYEEGRGANLQEERGPEDLWRDGRRGRDEEREDEESRFHRPGKEVRREAEKRDNRRGGENYSSSHADFSSRVSRSVLSLPEMCSPKRSLTPGGSTSDKTTPQSCMAKLPACPPPRSQIRRNTLPSVTVVPPPLHLPALVDQSNPHLRVLSWVSCSMSRSMAFPPRPPSSSPPSPSGAASARRPLPPLLPLASSITSLVAPAASSSYERSRRSQRRHSVQLEHIRGGAASASASASASSSSSSS